MNEQEFLALFREHVRAAYKVGGRINALRHIREYWNGFHFVLGQKFRCPFESMVLRTWRNAFGDELAETSETDIQMDYVKAMRYFEGIVTRPRKIKGDLNLVCMMEQIIAEEYGLA